MVKGEEHVVAQKNTSILKQDLIERIENKSARIGVVGLGYVGLPFLVEKAKVGFHVVGIDRSLERTGKVARGENYIGDVHQEELKAVVEAGLVTTSTNFEVVSDLDVIVARASRCAKGHSCGPDRCPP